jgi:succinyl-CoA synthetase beta subunit
MFRHKALNSSLWTSLQKTQLRGLNIHEYQAKQLMGKYSVPHQRGIVVESADQVISAAEKVMKDYNTKNLIIKAQILAGGRGKGHFNHGEKMGGVKFCTSAEAAKKAAEKMLGYRLTTIQTPKDGIEVKKVFVAECLDFSRELYFAILLDRAVDGAAIVASTEGGMDIEHVAATKPEAIHKIVVKNFDKGPSDQELTDLAQKLGFQGEKAKKAVTLMRNLYTLFLKTDATLIEINPLVETEQGEVVCIDGKMNFDDNAAFRQQDIFAMRDFGEEDPREVQASKFDLNYVGLDGNIGCMVNGAGLAMATMDVLKLYGGSPANFLDVGGGANTNQIKEAFKILNSDQNVQAILVNIFGGIMRCDVIAKGIIDAAKDIEMRVPLVVRLSGTNRDEGKKLLLQSGIKLQTADNLDEAAKKACATLAK